MTIAYDPIALNARERKNLVEPPAHPSWFENRADFAAVYKVLGPDPRKVDTSGVSYAALVSVAEVSASKTSGAERLHQECRRRVL